MNTSFYQALLIGMVVALTFGVVSIFAVLGFARWAMRQWLGERELKHNLANQYQALLVTLAAHGIDPEQLAAALRAPLSAETQPAPPIPQPNS